jgi:hypothetical protein
MDYVPFAVMLAVLQFNLFDPDAKWTKQPIHIVSQPPLTGVKESDLYPDRWMNEEGFCDL